MIWVLKHWKTILWSVVAAVLIGYHLLALRDTYYRGYDKAAAECKAAQDVANNNAVEVEKTQNEIRNNRPDVDAVIDSLRQAKF